MKLLLSSKMIKEHGADILREMVLSQSLYPVDTQEAMNSQKVIFIKRSIEAVKRLTI